MTSQVTKSNFNELYRENKNRDQDFTFKRLRTLRDQSFIHEASHLIVKLVFVHEIHSSQRKLQHIYLHQTVITHSLVRAIQHVLIFHSFNFFFFVCHFTIESSFCFNVPVGSHQDTSGPQIISYSSESGTALLILAPVKLMHSKL